MQVQIELPGGELETGEQPWHADAPTAGEYVFALHALHAADPDAALNFPASHAVQLPPSGPE